MTKKREPRSERARLVEVVRARLRRHGLARLQMSVIVVATGISGFLASAALVHLGVDRMGPRYALAFLLAYGTFLGLVRAWVELYRRKIDGAGDVLDFTPDVFDGADIPASWGGASGGDADLGAGGDFAGAGASAEWDGPSSGGSGLSPAPASHGAGGGIGDVLDLDEGWVVVVPIVIALGSLIAAFVLIWSAPGLLAELAIDVLLVSSLYHRLAHLERSNWLLTAVRKTWVPAAVVGVLLVAGGIVIQAVVPEARTMGDVLRRL